MPMPSLAYLHIVWRTYAQFGVLKQRANVPTLEKSIPTLVLRGAVIVLSVEILRKTLKLIVVEDGNQPMHDAVEEEEEDGEQGTDEE
ncbi:hypothetical protein RJT34_12560 [Clitoria ternatea]|uniref:Uncharacterized protein n=1 Tax=Clitoria ternatea TaxID=43366 RepID=A0AAN9JMD9_CLITE